jgi:hypothetical protein
MCQKKKKGVCFVQYKSGSKLAPPKGLEPLGGFYDMHLPIGFLLS